jgi:hypothetical protein
VWGEFAPVITSFGASLVPSLVDALHSPMRGRERPMFRCGEAGPRQLSGFVAH